MSRYPLLTSLITTAPEPAGHLDHLGSFLQLDISNISLALLVLGAYVCLVGQISYWLKERLYVSSALLSLCVGIAVGPIGLNWINPFEWNGNDQTATYELTYELCRIVIGIQVMFAGISLPAAYLWQEWKSLAILLGPQMIVAWLVSAGFILLLIPGMTFLESLCISACITPTDPILANAIVKGRYAEKHVAPHVRNIISAESGANDGLGFPFIFFTIFLMRRNIDEHQSIALALQHWVVQTWLYQIFLACAMGAVIGYIARKTLKFAHKRKMIDHESFLSYGIGLAFLVLGVVGILGSDDVLAAFVAGNSLTWRDFYRIESEDDTFQDVIDSLLNTSIFIYIGAIIPWSSFGDSGLLLTPWRLVVLGLCIMCFRRVPWVLALSPFTPALTTRTEALFASWQAFGPIGVSAIYYAMLAERELPEGREHLRGVIVPVVIFIALTSTLVHGITIPLTKAAPLALTHTRSFSSFAGQRSSTLFSRFRSSPVSTKSPATPSVSTPISTPAPTRPASVTSTTAAGDRMEEGLMPFGDLPPSISLSAPPSRSGSVVLGAATAMRALGGGAGDQEGIRKASDSSASLAKANKVHFPTETKAQSSEGGRDAA